MGPKPLPFGPDPSSYGRTTSRAATASSGLLLCRAEAASASGISTWRKCWLSGNLRLNSFMIAVDLAMSPFIASAPAAKVPTSRASDNLRASPAFCRASAPYPNKPSLIAFEGEQKRGEVFYSGAQHFCSCLPQNLARRSDFSPPGQPRSFPEKHKWLIGSALGAVHFMVVGRPVTADVGQIGQRQMNRKTVQPSA